MILKKAISNCDILIPIIDRISPKRGGEKRRIQNSIPTLLSGGYGLALNWYMKILASICGFIVQGFSGLACA